MNNYLIKRDFHINLTLAAIVEFESNSDSQKFKVAHHELVVLVAINLVSKHDFKFSLPAINGFIKSVINYSKSSAWVNKFVELNSSSKLTIFNKYTSKKFKIFDESSPLNFSILL